MDSASPTPLPGTYVLKVLEMGKGHLAVRDERHAGGSIPSDEGPGWREDERSGSVALGVVRAEDAVVILRRPRFDR